MKRYEHIDMVPTKAAQENARRALEVRQGKPESERGMTPVGIARARDIANGVRLSPETWRRVLAYFERHESDKSGETWDGQGKGWQAWMGWGGDENWATARRIVEQMNAADREAGVRAELRSEWHPEALRAEAGEMQDDGTMLGRWLRVACTGQLHSRVSGAELRPLTRDELVQMAARVNAAGDRNPVTWNWDHQTKTTDPGLRGLMPLDVQMPWGRVVSARVEDADGKAYLSVRTAWTPHGQSGVKAGAGALWPSVEFSEARFERDDGSEAPGLHLIGIAVTDSPAYAPGDVDPVVLRAETPPGQGINAANAAQEEAMDPEVIAKLTEALDALTERVASLESQMAPAEPAEGEAGEDMGELPEQMRSDVAALKGETAKVRAALDAAVKADAKAVAELRSEVADLKAAKQQAEFRSDFAAALVAGKVEASEQAVYLNARSEQAAGRPGFFEAVFGGRAEGQFRSEQAAEVSTRKADDGAADPLAGARAYFEARSEKFDRSNPNYADLLVAYSKEASK